MVEIDPGTGALIRTVMPSITCAGFVVTDPIGGDLFVDDSCGGGGSENGSIWRIANPGSASPSMSVYAATPGINGGMSFAPGGTLYLAAYRENNGSGGVDRVTGTTSSVPGQVSTLPGLLSPALGLVASGQQANGDARTLTLATAPGTDSFDPGIRTVDITTDPVATSSVVLDNAYANVQVVGPDGCQYASVSVAVYKITNADGSCPLRAEQPSLSLTPSSVSPDPAQGSSKSFTASFHNAAVAPGTPILFQVTGANPQVRSVGADANGTATLTYVGINAGEDIVTARAALDSSSVTSNPAHVNWTSGLHTTYLSMNASPAGATTGSPVVLAANLVDASVDPAAAVAGATIAFEVDGESCSGVTDAHGNATCSLTVPAIGSFTLTATYAGDAGHLPASVSQSFQSFDQDRIFKDGFEARP